MGALALAPSALALTFTVNSANDAADGVCDLVHCSLREAIVAANTADGLDVIAFSIGVGGSATIDLLAPLPLVDDLAVIDGTTQPGFGGSPIVELNGTGAGAGASGLIVTVNAAGSTVRGLVINRFSGRGILLQGFGGDVGGHHVAGNYIGTDMSGTVRLGALNAAIEIGSGGNTIGGLTASDRNVVADRIRLSGAGATGNLIVGNYVGVQAGGSGALGNPLRGIEFDNAPGNTIGGAAAAGARNVISGNGNDGILIAGAGSSGNTIQGNYIGLDPLGTDDLGNGWSGIRISNTPNTQIGGTAAGTGNVVSGNGTDGNSHDGIQLNGVATTGTVIQGNYVGTNAAGTAAIANIGRGIKIASGATATQIGGTVAGARNVVSGNGHDGIAVAANSNVIQGNYIGTDAAGGGSIGNGHGGVTFYVPGDGPASNNTVGGTAAGAGNLIANNPFGVFAFGGTGNAILGNSIFDNSQLGIDLSPQGVTLNDLGDGDAGANNLQNFPVLTAAQYTEGDQLTVSGTLNSAASQTFRIEIFASVACNFGSNYGEGQTFVGAVDVTTDASGNGGFTQTFTTGAQGLVITATATDAAGNTSEFSQCFTATDSDPPDTAILSAPDDYILDPTATFTFTPDEAAVSSIECKLDGGPFQTCTSPKTYTGLPNGHHVVQIRAIDAAGNVDPTPATHRFTVDTVPPAFGATLDQHQGARKMPENIGGTILSDSQRLAQQVVPGLSGKLTEVRFTMFCFGAPNVTLEVQDTSGAPNGSVLASATRTEVAGGNIVFRFPSPPAVAAGAPYALVLSGPAGTDNCTFPYNEDDPYPGTMYLSTNGGSTWNPRTDDLTFATFVHASLFTVTSALDTGEGTLRAAINGANANPDESLIVFQVGTGPVTIQPATGLPTITEPVTIDGTTQPGYDGTPIVEINGASVTDGSPGLRISAGDSTIRGLVLNRFTSSSQGALLLETAGGNVVEENYIGTNVAGTAALGNTWGIEVLSANNLIRDNVVSGNDVGILILGSSGPSTGDDNDVQANLIGTNVAGNAPLGNEFSGIQITGGNGNRIGAAASGAGNVISANGRYGITIRGTGNVIKGNSIGTGVDQNQDLGNADSGIRLLASNTTVGGIEPLAGNRIAFNLDGVFVLGNADSPELWSGNTIRGNSIEANDRLGIDLENEIGFDPNGVTPNDPGDGDDGANHLQNFPEIQSVQPTEGGGVRIVATLSGQPNTAYTFDWYANASADPSGFGEGQRWVGWSEMSTDADGNLTIDTGSGLTAAVAEGEWITGTATGPNPSTSEFSEAVQFDVGPIVVTNTNDAGEGSLRQAIVEANDPGTDTIEFNIEENGPPHTISLLTALPEIAYPVTIDGTTEPDYDGAPVVQLNGNDLDATGLVIGSDAGGSVVRGLVIRRFAGAGIRIWGAGSKVEDNYIGTDVSGLEASPNGAGIAIQDAAQNEIRRNLISGNTGNGIEIFAEGSPDLGNMIFDNVIGVASDGESQLGNGGDGVSISGGDFTFIGDDGELSDFGVTGGPNTIAYNGGAGVYVAGSGGGHRIVANSIHSNGGLGIDLDPAGVTPNDAEDADTGPNGLQNFPVIQAVEFDAAEGSAGTVSIDATVDAASTDSYRIDYYASATCDLSRNGEGARHLGHDITTPEGGVASFDSTSIGPVTAGEFLTATVTAPTDAEIPVNTSEFSVCFTVVAAVEDLSVSVEQSTLPTGWDSIGLDEFPVAALPFFAGPLSVPVGSTPVGSTPVGSTPVGSTPVGSTPVGSTPVGSTPVGSTPVGSTPVGSTGLAGIPVGSTALSFVLASSIPIDWDPIVLGSGLQGRPSQTFTLQDVLADDTARTNFNTLVTLGEAGLENTVLRGVSWASLLIGSKTVAEVPPPGGGTWADFLTNTDGVTDQTTILGLDVAGRLRSSPVGSTPVGSTPVGSTPVGSTKVGDIAGGIANTPVGSTPVGSTHFADTRLGEVVLANILDIGAVVPACVSSCSFVTLGDAHAANAIDPSATLADLAPAINHMTINELVIAVVGRAGLPWEALPIAEFAAYASPQTLARYTVSFTAACPDAATLTASVLLPFHFILKPGTSELSLGGAPFQPLGEPETDAVTGATWELVNVCTEAAAQQPVAIRFQAMTGSRVGTLSSSATVTAAGGTFSATGQAPLLVQQRGEFDDVTPTLIEPDRIYLRHAPTTGDVDTYRLPIPPEGTVVSVFLGHLSADLDLAIQIPQQTLQSAPVGSTPVGSTPIEDRGISITGDNPSLPPEGLQDIPVGSTPVGSTPVGSTSINRGTADELVQVVSNGEEGFYTIRVIGYNGESSADGYTLRVRQEAPPQLPPCDARVLPHAGEPDVAVTLPDPASLPDTTKTLFLLLENQLRDLYPGPSVDALLSAIHPAPTTVAGHVNVQGVPLRLDANTAVAQEIQELNANPCKSPNDFVRAVNDALVPYRNELPNLEYLVFVGTNEAFPMGWKRDRVTLSNATDYAANLLFTTQNGNVANASYAAAFTGNVLTDDVYTSLTERPFLGESFPLPDLASGRLLETPEEMVAQLAQFLDAGGVYDPATASSYTAAYDFLLDGGSAVHTSFLDQGFALTLAQLNESWDAQQVLTDYFAALAPPDIGAVWGHYDHYRMQPAAGTALVSTEAVDDATTGVRFPGDILFTVGCNSGQNVADTLIQTFSPIQSVAEDQQRRLRDWAQAWARQKTAVYIGNTSFGYGDTDFVALSEKLGKLLAARMPEATSMGQKLVAVKHDYFNQMGTYGVFDEKALVEWTLYGLPHWRPSSGTTPALPAAPATTAGPVSGLESATLTLGAAELAKARVDSARGSFWQAADGSTHSQPYRQPQSVHSFDQTVQGFELRGALIKSLATDNQIVDPHLHIPTVDNQAHEPEPVGFTNTFFPANHVSVTAAGGRSIVTVVGSQQRPTVPISADVATRLVTGMGLQLLYAPTGSADGPPPVFVESGSTRTGTELNLFARVRGNPFTVEALVTQDGVSWQRVTLVNTANTDLWTGTATLASADEADALFNAANAFGRVAYTTAKGALHRSVPASQVEDQLEVLIESPPEGAVYTKGQSVQALYGCTGAFVTLCAGPVPNGGAVDTDTVGERAFRVEAQNVSGAEDSDTNIYSVHYAFTGFFSPIANAPVVNSVRAGSAVPVKFSLGGNQGLDIFATGYPKSQAMGCNGTDLNSVTETVTAGSSSLSYDATTDRYNYVWKTERAWAGTCRKLVGRLNDGTEHVALFKLT